MKRTTALLLAAVLLLGALTACGKTEPAVQTAEQPVQSAAPITRADLEKAAIAAAWAYYFKGSLVQYDSEILTPELSKYYGGSYRLTEYAAPEFGTADKTIHSVCSDFCHKSWYNGTGINVLGGPLGATTTSCWEEAESQGILVKRYIREDYTLKDRDLKMGITADSPFNLKDHAEAEAFFSDYENTMRPGDWIVSTGHAMLYMGNGYIVDCAGKKYDVSTGEDRFEADGALNGLHDLVETMVKSEGHLGHYGIDGKNGNRISILRPSDYLCVDDGDGDPANDIVADPAYRLPAETATREQFDGLEIRRTSSAHDYQAVEQGGTITYSVQLSNCSDNADYVTFRQRADAGYQGAAFADITVTETVPAGTELIAADGAEQKDGKLFWTVSLAPGETKTLTYSVKVTAPRGTVITNAGGTVGQIPSNVLTATVGGRALTAEDAEKLLTFGKDGVSEWYPKYNIGDCGGLSFAEKVYKDVLGIALELPTEQQVFESLFEQYHHTAQGVGYNSEKRYEGWPYILRKDDGSELRQMLVNGYAGGKAIYFAKPEVCLQELNFDYLQPGDILLNMKLSGEVEQADVREVTLSEVSVYLGDGRLATSDQFGMHFSRKGLHANRSLWETMRYDVYLALRPTQAYEDIHTMTYDASAEAKMPEPKKNVQTVTVAQPLSDANKAKLAALTAEAFADQKNLEFAASIYDAIGISKVREAWTLDGKVLTLTGILGQICIKDGSAADDIRGYALTEVGALTDRKFAPAHAMFVDDHQFGIGFYHAPEKVPYPLAELQVGDVVMLGNWGISRYASMVYQGDGRFLRCDYSKDGTKTVDQVTMDEAAFAEYANDAAWRVGYLLRPSDGFENING